LWKIPPDGEIAKEHSRLMEVMFENVSDLEARLKETKTRKLEALKRGGKKNVSYRNRTPREGRGPRNAAFQC
jgi:hypothetical protein